MNESSDGRKGCFSAAVIAARDNGAGSIFTEWSRSGRDRNIV